jgi:hypothetical protein
MKALGIVAAIIAALYGLYAYYYPSATVRYRLTLVIEADGQQHSGSGVIQVTYGKNLQLLGVAKEIYVNVKGEAVTVDIPGRGTLFALLKEGQSPRSSPEWIVTKAFGFPGGGLGHPLESSLARLRELSGRVELSPNDLPLLVRFRDINDPKTVERVDPNDLARSFGAGVDLKRVTVEITRDPVTTGIEQRLTWLRSLRSRGASLDGDTSVARTSNELANILGPGSFQAGVR